MKRTILSIIALTVWAFAAAAAPVSGADALPEGFKPRGGLPNFFAATAGAPRAVKAVYLGGSITSAQNGWRDITYNWLRSACPGVVMLQHNAAIGGTGSNLGVFRVESDVLSQKPDLVFVEFAVNDGSREHQAVVRTMEGIVRKIWTASPATDIFFVYTVDKARFEDLAAGKLATAVQAMEEVADRYGIPSLHMGYAVLDLYKKGKLTFNGPVQTPGPSWLDGGKVVFTTDSVHPLPESGHPVYASSVVKCLRIMQPDTATAPHAPLPAPLDALNWQKARKLEFSQADLSGWTLLTDKDEVGSTFQRFVKNIWRGTPGSTIRFSFRGTVLGLYDFQGPKSGKIAVTIDSVRTEYMRFDRHCHYHRLSVLMLAENLEDKVHDVLIEVLDEPFDKLSILGKENREKMEKKPSAFAGVEYNIACALIVGEFVKTGPDKLEASVKAADALWRGGKLPQAIEAYQTILKGGVTEEYGSLVWLRLLEAQVAAGRKDDARRTLEQMAQLEWQPAFHKMKMQDIALRLEGTPDDYRNPVPAIGTVSATIHVDQSAKAGGDGSTGKPFTTIEEALKASSTMIRGGKLAPGAVEIVLHGERYTIRGTVKMGKEYSGTQANPLVIRSADVARPTAFTGGVNIARWSVEKDPAVLDLLPAAARGHVLVADLAENGATGIDRIIFGGFGSGRSKSGTYRFNTMPIPELFCNGRVQELARWPNGRDTVWSVNKFNDPRARKWAQDDDVWLHGYWKYLYADSYEKVGGFDGDRLQLTPPYNRYGFSDETRGLITETRWYALNVLSEMDTPGEWKISAARGKIWLFPPKGFDPKKCILSTYGMGIEMQDCDHVTVRDLQISYMRGDGIVATDCNDLTFANCSIHDLSGLGIQILGGTGHTLHSLRINSMGRGGIYLQSGDKTTLAPSRSLVENCHISDLSRIDRTYTPAVLLDGVGITVQRCRFEEIPSSAIRLEGNDMLIQLNDIGRCVLESNDQGSIDIWFNSLFRGNVIRWNYFHDIGSPKRMAGAVRMDDAISGVFVHENIMRRSATHEFGAVQIHGGNYNFLEGNIFLEDKAAVSNTLWPDEYWNAHWRNDRTVKILTTTDWQGKLWQGRYPELKNLYDNPNLNYIRDNKVVNCPDFYVRNSGNAQANLIDRAEFFNNDVIRRGAVPADLKRVAALGDPWHRIPVGEIGLYNVK